MCWSYAHSQLTGGIGLLALTLQSLGYDVLATDSAEAFSLLERNVEKNRHSHPSHLEAKVLDWFTQPSTWTWNTAPGDNLQTPTPLGPPFDLIVTTDTVYIEALFDPLLRTIKALAEGQKTPIILLALEERDHQSIEEFWRRSEEQGFTKKEIKIARLGKAVKQYLGWKREDWQGVRVYELFVR